MYLQFLHSKMNQKFNRTDLNFHQQDKLLEMQSFKRTRRRRAEKTPKISEPIWPLFEKTELGAE